VNRECNEYMFAHDVTYTHLFSTFVLPDIVPVPKSSTTGLEEDKYGLRVLGISELAGKRVVRKLVGKPVCLPGGGLETSLVVLGVLEGAGVLC
jgi:hypothetical protein